MIFQSTDISYDQLPVIVRKLIPFIDNYKVLLLKGDLGAGKTTLTKMLLKEMGYSESVSSPTYGIVNEYLFKDQKVSHFDLYRIKDEYELVDLAFEDAISASDLAIIEWPDNFLKFFDGALILEIKYNEGNRDYTLSSVG
jgi:tRNA threonylcarbamoyladenosine biosynthesis protein TsaE